MNAMAGAFAGESLTRDPDAEDPHMLQYVEAELAKRRQASGGEPSGVAETAEDAPKPPPSAELWETPAAVSAPTTTKFHPWNSLATHAANHSIDSHFFRHPFPSLVRAPSVRAP